MMYLREPCARLKLQKSTNAQRAKSGTAASLALLEAPVQMKHRPSPGTLEVDYDVIAGVNGLLRSGPFVRVWLAKSR